MPTKKCAMCRVEFVAWNATYCQRCLNRLKVEDRQEAIRELADRYELEYARRHGGKVPGQPIY